MSMPASQPKPEGASTILVMGILGLLLCQILAIVAWVKGNTYMAQCRAMGVEPEQSAVWGRRLGIISVILTILAVIAVVVVVVIMAASGVAVQPGAGMPAR